MKNAENQQIKFADNNDPGELVVDVYETEKDVVVESAIAGITANELDISLEQDILVIKGERKDPADADKDKNYFVKECYFGSFEKEIILPKEVDTSQIKAKMKNGLLIIRRPKQGNGDHQKIEIK